MKFKFNPRIIQQLGTELITSNYIAFVELIKNSFDAGSPTTIVHFLSNLSKISQDHFLTEIDPRILEIVQKAALDNEIAIVEDAGCGMSLQTIQTGFFEIGSDLKLHEKEKREKDQNTEVLLGDKGIGRLAAQRLAPLLILETCQDGTTHVVEIFWQDFLENANATAPHQELSTSNSQNHTRLWLIGMDGFKVALSTYFQNLSTIPNRDLFGELVDSTGKKIKLQPDFEAALNYIKSPFDIGQNNRMIKVTLDGSEIPVEFKSETLKLAETIHEFEISKTEKDGKTELSLKMSMKVTPWFIERTHANELDTVFTDWKREHTFYKEIQEKYAENLGISLTEEASLLKIIRRRQSKIPLETLSFISDIAPISGKIYSFKRESNYAKLALESAFENGTINSKNEVESDLKSFLEVHNGIKLYRNDYRIGTIGNKDNDWFQLQQKRTKGQQYIRFDLANVIGYVQLNDPFQKRIKETILHAAIKVTF